MKGWTWTWPAAVLVVVFVAFANVVGWLLPDPPPAEVKAPAVCVEALDEGEADMDAMLHGLREHEGLALAILDLAEGRDANALRELRELGPIMDAVRDEVSDDEYEQAARKCRAEGSET